MLAIVLAPAGVPEKRTQGAEESIEAFIVSDDNERHPSTPPAPAREVPLHSPEEDMPHLKAHIRRVDRASTQQPGAASAWPSTVGSQAELTLPGESLQFRQTLYQHIERYRRYPESARRAQLSGVVQVSFIMDRAGAVLSAWIQERSGFSVLDEEALATIWRAQPLPPIPPRLPDRMQIVLPISFHVS